MIVYVTEREAAGPPHGEDPLHGVEDLIEASRTLGVSSVSVALCQEDVVSGWACLIACGIQEVLFQAVIYDAACETFESRGAPLRLCGYDRRAKAAPSIHLCND
jgi:hypothetical protein